MPAASRTCVYRPTPVNVRRLAGALRRGELVAVPTETVYGLAAHALDPVACAAIFTAKGRPTQDPLIVHLASPRDLPRLGESNALVTRLAAAFWPGPLTLVIRKTALVPDIVTAGLDSVAVRVPSHPLFRRLIRAVGGPLAAPSANPFGYVSPTTAAHVRQNLGGLIPHILDGGPCAIGVESTIIDARDPAHPRLLRAGGVPAATLEKLLGQRLAAGPVIVAPDVAAVAPGLLSRHYSPHTPLTLHRRLPRALCLQPLPGIAVVQFAPATTAANHPNVLILSPDGTAATAATRLFSLLRDLDQAGHQQLHFELAPATDPWAEAVNDRLRRAASKR